MRTESVIILGLCALLNVGIAFASTGLPGTTQSLNIKRNPDQAESNSTIMSITDYDCNGDGRDDCGVWDWSLSMCANRVRCAHQYKFPDASLASSCRCVRTACDV